MAKDIILNSQFSICNQLSLSQCNVVNSMKIVNWAVKIKRLQGVSRG